MSFKTQFTNIMLQGRHKQNGQKLTMKTFFKTAGDYSIQQLYTSFKAIFEESSAVNLFVFCINRGVAKNLKTKFLMMESTDEILKYMKLNEDVNYNANANPIESYFRLKTTRKQTVSKLKELLLGDRFSTEDEELFDQFVQRFRIIQTSHGASDDIEFEPFFKKHPLYKEGFFRLLWNAFQFEIWKWYGSRNGSAIDAERAREIYFGQYSPISFLDTEDSSDDDEGDEGDEGDDDDDDE